MRMSGDTDEPSALGLAMPVEIFPELFVAILARLGCPGITTLFSRDQEVLDLCLVIDTQDGLPPVGIRSQAVKMIAPLPQLNGPELTRPVQDPQGVFTGWIQDAGASLDLHATTIGGIADHRPSSLGDG